MPIINKPNSNPISEKPKMNANLYVIEDYRKKDDFVVRINKPNFQNGQNERKLTYNKGLQKKRLFSSPKNKPNSNPISSKAFPSLWKKIIDMPLLLWNNEPPYEGSNENIIGSGCI